MDEELVTALLDIRDTLGTLGPLEDSVSRLLETAMHAREIAMAALSAHYERTEGEPLGSPPQSEEAKADV